MAKKASGTIGGASSTSPQSEKPAEKLGRRGTPPSETRQKPSAHLDTRVIYCGDNLEQLAKLPDACNSAFRTPHSAIAVTGSFYYHCDWHASHYVKVML
jgi:hypothetical protein